MNRLGPLIIALTAELGTSWWRWVRAPTDGLRVAYGGVFWSYESHRFGAWLVIVLILYVTWLLLQKRRKVMPSAD